MREVIPDPVWPDGKRCAVSLTFDVDAEAGFTGANEKYKRQLTTLSEGEFSITRGLPRVLSLLREFDIQATFYVPGETLDHHAAAIEQIATDGHELAHHGYKHLWPHHVDLPAQQAELEQGLEAFDRRLSLRPKGYRSPAWEVTPETFELLVKLDFDYDSSFMGDDRPYIERQGVHHILEFPVHWSLDDYPYFGWHPDARGTLAHPATFRSTWLDQFATVLDEGSHVTYTMHPEVIGRGYRIRALRAVLEGIASEDCVFLRHGQLAALLRAGGPA